MELNQRKPSWKRSFHVSIGILLGGCQAGEVQCGAIEECISVGDQKSKRFTIEFFCLHDEVKPCMQSITLCQAFSVMGSMTAQMPGMKLTRAVDLAKVEPLKFELYLSNSRI